MPFDYGFNPGDPGYQDPYAPRPTTGGGSDLPPGMGGGIGLMPQPPMQTIATSRPDPYAGKPGPTMPGEGVLHLMGHPSAPIGGGYAGGGYTQNPTPSVPHPGAPQHLAYGNAGSGSFFGGPGFGIGHGSMPATGTGSAYPHPAPPMSPPTGAPGMPHTQPPLKGGQQRPLPTPTLGVPQRY